MSSSVIAMGPVIADLHYQAVNAPVDQEGLIFGSVSIKSTDSVTDASMNTVKRETVYNVRSFLPARNINILFDRLGQIVLDVFNDACSTYDMNEIIGYYKLRRQTSMQPSMRELAVVENLQTWLDARNSSLLPNAASAISSAAAGTAEQLPRCLFSLLTTTVSENRACHTWDNVFFIRPLGIRPPGENWERIALSIPNLTSQPRGEYILDGVPAAPSVHSGSYDDILNAHAASFMDKNDPTQLAFVKALNDMNADQRRKLDVVARKLIEAEKEEAKEEQEIRELQEQIAAIKQLRVSQATARMSDNDQSAVLACGAPITGAAGVKQEKDLINLEDDEDSLAITCTHPNVIRTKSTDTTAVNSAVRLSADIKPGLSLSPAVMVKLEPHHATATVKQEPHHALAIVKPEPMERDLLGSFENLVDTNLIPPISTGIGSMAGSSIKTDDQYDPSPAASPSPPAGVESKGGGKDRGKRRRAGTGAPSRVMSTRGAGSKQKGVGDGGAGGDDVGEEVHDLNSEPMQSSP